MRRWLHNYLRNRLGLVPAREVKEVYDKWSEQVDSLCRDRRNLANTVATISETNMNLMEELAEWRKLNTKIMLKLAADEVKAFTRADD